MTTASVKKNLDDMLAGAIGRDELDQLVELIYASYTSVDQADSRIKQMEADLEGLTGDEARDMTEKLGILHFARGNYAAAAERLKAVRSRKTASHFLGRAYLKLGREREALACLADGRAGEDDPATDVLMVEAYCNLREADEAAEILKKRASDKEPPGILYARGRVAETNGEYAEAMELYEAALENDPQHAESLFRLGLNCDLNGEDDRAMELYKRCADLRPTFVGALVNLAVLYEDHNLYQEAINCYERVLAIDPGHQQAQLYLKDAESSVTMHMDVTKSRRLRRKEEVFRLPVGSFELSARSRTCLDRMDIKTLGALTRVTREKLLNEKNFGDTSLEEVEALLARYDLELGEAAGATPPAGSLIDAGAKKHLGMPVEALELSTRCRRCMERLGITTVQLSEENLLAVPNFGSTSLNEIATKLAGLGLSLKSE
jgi:DNA-directed RNA polymerase subunit alpha